MRIGEKGKPRKPGRKKLPDRVGQGLANRLREALEERHISTTDVARRLGLAGSKNVARWVAKRNPAAPDLVSFVQLCDAFMLNANHLLFGEGTVLRVAGSEEDLGAKVRERIVAELRARRGYEERLVRTYLSHNEDPVRTLVTLYDKLMKFDTVARFLGALTSKEATEFRRLLPLGIIKGVRYGEEFTDQFDAADGLWHTRKGRPRNPARPAEEFGLGLANKQLREKIRAAREQGAQAVGSTPPPSVREVKAAAVSEAAPAPSSAPDGPQAALL